MKLELNQIISNRYQIIEQIGVGGMANVYCASDIKLDRKVTFKVLKEEFIDEEFIKKFNKEAMAAAKISHLNIANVYDVGNDGNIHYIVMEYIDGYTLKDIIKIKAPFSNEEILGISIQIANALSVAHNAGIIHRDIKPENILITKQGNAKVTDFGIARATSSNTITTDAMGSVHYFSPEQARGGFTDFKSDIYSLGIVMYEMATGKIPFDGEGVVQLAMKHINDPLPDMRELNPNISESLEKIILKTTEKNPDNRYKSSELLIEDLKKAIYDESGNFIVKEDFTDSPTVVITPEQIEMINKLSSNNTRNESLGGKQKANNRQTDKYEADMYEDKNKNKIIDKGKKNMGNNLKGNKKNLTERKVTIWAIITGLSIAIIITVFLIFWTITGKKSEVPDFTGKTFEEAVEIAKDKEIYIRNTAEEYSDTVKEGAIISQSVDAGEDIKKGDTIDVTISLGTGKFNIDNFVGMDISEVYKKVQNIDIKLIEEYVDHDEIEIGKVVKQSPRAGSTINIGDEVTLYISKGTEEKLVIVPNLINLTESEAKATLRSAGLSVGRISMSESNSVEEGCVISQSINYGNEVEEGKAISLVISSGPSKETTTAETTKEQTETTTAETTKEEQIETTTEAVTQEITVEEITNNFEQPVTETTTVISSPNSLE
ncbi:MAG: Stk1 family PASTA domain-containing Ser/Thr kinase [Eubacteriales bacterium]|nr:Stk1 family PASTA domain-containing Ser/Thr kinase [Eubacteriales bacterium]